MPVVASAFSAYGSSPYSAGDIVSPDGLVTKVATHVMRGTFDPKKVYNGDTDPNGIDPQTGTAPLEPHVVYGGTDGAGKGTYFQFDRNHHGEWKSGQAVGLSETVFKDGKLWRANTSLSSAQNTDADFSTNWTSLGSQPTVQTLLTASSMTRCFHIGGKCSNDRLQLDDCLTILSRNPFNSAPVAGLDKVANGPGTLLPVAVSTFMIRLRMNTF